MPYLDHAATTPLREEVLDAMLPFLREAWGNPSSLHGPGRRARVAVDRARERVARVLGCEPGEVVFTSGGTEADNLALRGALAGMRRQSGRGGLVTSAVEHEAVLQTAHALEEEGGDVTVLPPDADGRIAVAAVAGAVNETTGLVSVMLVNNEIGTVNPVGDIADAAHAAGALVHTDAVQAAGLLVVDVDALGVDLLSLSGHKVGGPKGVGALVVRAGTPFRAVQTGGSQERRRRGGTENVAGIVCFAEALALAAEEREATAARLTALRDALRQRLVEALGERLVVNTPTSGAAPHVLSVSIRPGPGGPVDGEMLLTALDLEGVHVSAGSACTSGALEPSHVLQALGLPRDVAGATVRFSMGRTTTDADVTEAKSALIRVLERLDAVAV